MNDPDYCARDYMRWAYREMEDGNCPAGFAGKTVAHVFDDSSDDLRRDVLAMIEAVDEYLKTWTPRPDAGDHYIESTTSAIRFWRTTERPFYMASKHAQVTA